MALDRLGLKGAYNSPSLHFGRNLVHDICLVNILIE